MKIISKKYQSILICAVLVLLVLAAFEPVRHNGFVDYDDSVYIYSNPHIRDGITSRSLVWAFTADYGANWYPLTWLSHMMDVELFGLNPVWHHVHNLVLHAIAAIFLFLVLRDMTGSIWCSAFIATVFGIHPLRVESVVWAVERKDVLCAVFWMLTIMVYIHYARHGSLFRYGLTLICLCLGLMAKPMTVTLPLVLLLLDFWPMNRITLSRQGGKKRIRCQDSVFRTVSIRQAIIEKIPFFILVVISCIITYHVQQKWGAVADTAQTSWSLRLTNIPISYTRYLFKTIWPVNLAVLYPFPKDGWSAWQTAGAVLVFAGCSVGALYFARKRPYIFVGWFWYVITLIPVIGLVQVGNQSIADRYSYLPSVGILILLVWTAQSLSQSWRYREQIFTALIALSIVAMVIVSRAQVVHWKDSLALYQHAIAVTRDNFMIYNNLASMALGENDLDRASDYIQKSLAIRPDFYLTNINKALLLKNRKQYDQALTCIEKVMKYADAQWQAHWVRGEILEEMGRLDQALQSYKSATELNQDEFLPFYKAGLLSAKRGSLQEAIYYFQESIRCNPDYSTAYRDLGQARQFLGQLDEAILIYQKALRVNPDDHAARYRLGYCLEQQGKLSEAVDCYRLVLQLQPDFLPARSQLAMILATASDDVIRDPSEAVRLSEKGCEITQYKDCVMLNTLAAAYAGAGRFQEAIGTIQKAIDLARANNDVNSVKQMTEKLELYRSGGIHRKSN